MKTMRVFVIIVNWNGLRDTILCLKSLHALDRKKTDASVVIVDNGSTDNSAVILAKAYPWATVVPLEKNEGYTGGNNAGIQYALQKHADFIWLLNNDAYADKHALSILDCFSDMKVGAAGSKIYFAPGCEYHYKRYKEQEKGKVLWYAGGLIDWNNMYATHRGVDEVDRGQYDSIEKTQFISGCSMVIRTDVIRKIGLFDPKYYLYYEDLDYCLRMQKAGYSTVYMPQSVVWHTNAASSGKPGSPLHDYYLMRNRFYIGFRYAPIRTKIALLRELFVLQVYGSQLRRRAAFDALFGLYGKRYEFKQ